MPDRLSPVAPDLQPNASVFKRILRKGQITEKKSAELPKKNQPNYRKIISQITEKKNNSCIFVADN